jgi:hypothetical protein
VSSVSFGRQAHGISFPFIVIIFVIVDRRSLRCKFFWEVFVTLVSSLLQVSPYKQQKIICGEKAEMHRLSPKEHRKNENAPDKNRILTTTLLGKQKFQQAL